MTSSALSQAITFKVQSQVLKNLRAELVYANPAYAQQGTFQPGYDTLSFVTVPDLALNTTVLTEGTAPTTQALSLSTTSVSTAQYGQTVTITDIAKVKSPVDLASLVAERLSRQAKESIDKVIRDVIAASGTPAYALGNSTNAVRSDIAAGEIIVGKDLTKLRATMFKNKIPPFPDGLYRIFLSPNQGYDLRTDTASGTGWMDIEKYTNADPLLRGQLGILNGFRVFEVVNAPTFSSTTTVHAAIAVGNIQGWGMGDLQTLSTPHVGPEPSKSDPLGQQEIWGWKVDFGAAALNNGYYYRLETAATTI